MTKLQKAKNNLKERIDPGTTPPLWRKVRNVAGVIAGVGGVVISPVFPMALPIVVAKWVTFATVLAGVVSGRAHMTKK